MIMSDEDISSSDDDISSSSEKSVSASASNSRLGGKDELAKAEGVMRSNSSYIDLTQTLTKRMRDDTLDHSKVLSEAKHTITRICLTGGPVLVRPLLLQLFQRFCNSLASVSFWYLKLPLY